LICLSVLQRFSFVQSCNTGAIQKDDDDKTLFTSQSNRTLLMPQTEIFPKENSLTLVILNNNISSFPIQIRLLGLFGGKQMQ